MDAASKVVPFAPAPAPSRVAPDSGAATGSAVVVAPGWVRLGQVASVGLLTLDRDRRIGLASPMAAKLLGVSVSSLRGQPLEFLAMARDRARVRTHLQRALAGERRIFLLSRPGSGRRRRWTQIETLPMAGLAEANAGVVALLLDVSARRELTECRKRLARVRRDEQQRLGAELHDNLGQRLTAMEFQCQAWHDQLRAAASPLAESAAHLARQLREATAEVRGTAHGLMAEATEARPLHEALAGLARQIDQPPGTRCRFVRRGSDQPIRGNLAHHLSRIAQEAINNALKHGRPRRIIIVLTTRRTRVALKITDDGDGGGTTALPARGAGLALMRRRAASIGAVLQWRRRPAAGVEVTCTAPLP